MNLINDRLVLPDGTVILPEQITDIDFADNYARNKVDIIFKCTVPKGEKVYIGNEFGFTVVVSDVIILEREVA